MQTEPQSQELIEIKTIKAVDVFGSVGGVEKILEEIKSKAIIAAPDISTEKGKDLIRSRAYAVARTKTALDDMGKELVSDLKKQTGAIDEMRRALRDNLDDLRDAVRKPLTDFEDAEKARIKAHVDAMNTMRDMMNFAYEPKSDDVQERLQQLQEMETRDFQEYQDQANTIRENAINRLSELLAKIIKGEEEAAELTLLRAEAAARAEQDREAERARVAQREAEAEAQKAITAAQREAQDKVNAAEAQTRAANERAEASEREGAAMRAAETKAEQDRAADLEHRRKINNAVMQAFFEVLPNLEEDMAKEVIKAIAGGKIPHVKINY